MGGPEGERKEGMWVEGRARGRNVWREGEDERRGARKGRMGGVAARPGQGEGNGRSFSTPFTLSFRSKQEVYVLRHALWGQ